VNRGNDRRDVFHEPKDYQLFLKLLDSSREAHPVDVIAYCPMSNHFHLVLRPRTDTALSAYMKQVTGSYACNYRCRTNTVGHGHVFQRRFWNKPIDSSEQLLATLRYVEANPLRAGLVSRAEDWPWSSLHERGKTGSSGLLAPSPVPLPSYWPDLVNLPQTEDVLIRIHEALTRRPGRPKRAARDAE
jgi:putative transposase